MANQEHLDLLKQGVQAWNKWRDEHSDVRPDLSEADLSNRDLKGVDLFRADLYKANLSEADLREADLRNTDLTYADLRKTDLRDAKLNRAILCGVNLSGADLSGCNVYSTAAWNVQTENTIQNDLIITHGDEPVITVDNLEVAQFIYLLLNNKKIRDVLDTITSKVVLILGRFTPERKAILDALKNELRKKNYLPVLFDFEKPAKLDPTETISTLAHMARFIIADLTDPRSIPQELQAIVPNLPSVPVQPLILNVQHEYGTFEHITRYSWVLPIYRYSDEASLLDALQEKIIAPVEEKVKELESH